jgi:hypothetical protein
MQAELQKVIVKPQQNVRCVFDVVLARSKRLGACACKAGDERNVAFASSSGSHVARLNSNKYMAFGSREPPSRDGDATKVRVCGTL